MALGLPVPCALLLTHAQAESVPAAARAATIDAVLRIVS